MKLHGASPWHLKWFCGFLGSHERESPRHKAVASKFEFSFFTQASLISIPSLTNDRRVSRPLRFLHILVVPRQIPLVSIANEARPCNTVKLVRVDYQLRVDSQAAQRLIHLLPTLDRHIKVALPTEEQRRCLDAVGVQEGV